MKKSLLLFAAVAATSLFTGCAGLGGMNGMPNAGIGIIYNEAKVGALLQQPSTNDYTVIAHNVVGKGKNTCIFGLIGFGDVSYETLKKDALSKYAGADDVIDVKIDCQCNNIIGINKVDVTMTGTAIKYKK